MMRAHLVTFVFGIVSFVGCGIYSPYGAQTSGAKTYSVSAFEAVTPLASATSALALTESLRDRIQKQSTLQLMSSNGQLKFEAEIVRWEVVPVNVQQNDQAASNRLTIGLHVRYENTLDDELSFDRTFSRFADYSSDQDLFSVEDQLVEDIGSQLSQDIFNASLGNW
ncbi:MAG: LPS assembly lipoprotein LptE [Flavobacteriales bacterium]|nr:LPS assembly lipoprotein LptE [Flavobacteriales bacterium]